MSVDALIESARRRGDVHAEAHWWARLVADAPYEETYPIILARLKQEQSK